MFVLASHSIGVNKLVLIWATVARLNSEWSESNKEKAYD